MHLHCSNPFPVCDRTQRCSSPPTSAIAGPNSDSLPTMPAAPVAGCRVVSIPGRFRIASASPGKKFASRLAGMERTLSTDWLPVRIRPECSRFSPPGRSTARRLRTSSMMRTLFHFTVNLESPNKVGIDRLLNAVAANVVRANNQPCVIVDTGTATTVDAVSPDGVFEGGADPARLRTFGARTSSVHRPASVHHDRRTRGAIARAARHKHSRSPSQRTFLGTDRSHPRTDRAARRAVGSEADRIPHRRRRDPGRHAIPQSALEPHLSLQGLVIASRG